MECNCNPSAKRIILGNIEYDDLSKFELIVNKIDCARQAARPDAIPDGIDPDKAKLYIQAAIDSLATYTWLEKDMWKTVKEKYNLPKDKNVYADFIDSVFYYLEE
jgi:hypothetical protein